MQRTNEKNRSGRTPISSREAADTVQRWVKLQYPRYKFNIEAIVKEFHHKFGHYDIPSVNIHSFWGIVSRHNLTFPDAPFEPRDWDAPEHAGVSPHYRYEIADGPTSGDVAAVWQPGWGINIEIAIEPCGKNIGIPLNDARRLLDDLKQVLDEIDR